MPDRDEFAHLPRRMFAVRNGLMRAATDGEFDDLGLADALDRLLTGGVASLPVIIGCLQKLRPDDGQAAFDDPGLLDAALDGIEAVSRRESKNQLDQILARSAQRSIIGGIADPHQMVMRFLHDLLSFAIVDSKHGVADELARQGQRLDRAQLREHVWPVIDLAAARIVRQPSFKRLGLCARLRRPVDLTGDNLNVGGA